MSTESAAIVMFKASISSAVYLTLPPRQHARRAHTHGTRSTMLRAGFLAALLLASASALILSVSEGDEECVFESVDKDNKLVGSFEVLSGGSYDIDATVTGPNGNVHFKQLRQKSGSLQVMAPVSGLYQVCFSNKAGSSGEKLVAVRPPCGRCATNVANARPP
jgi:hypothetical protein